MPKRLLRIWYKMIERCESQSNAYYKCYGGKGVIVCDDWHDPNIFAKWAMTNGYSDNLTIDRIDYNGNYEPNNCRWVTMKKQQNNKSDNRYETINGVTKTVQEWIEYYGVDAGMVRSRLARGWDLEKAISKPSEKRYRGLKVICIDTGDVFESFKKAGKKFGVSGEAIRAAIYSKSNECCGMKWKLYNEKPVQCDGPGQGTCPGV